MKDSDQDPDNFKSEYRSDKRRNGWGSICFGILFIAWSAFDIATGFWDEYWYANIFFILLGVIFIAFGVMDIRKNSPKKPD